MRKVKLYIAISLNGKIARVDGSVDWLDSIPNPEKTDYGYSEFQKSIDTTIQGNNTYKQVMDWGIDFPYKGTANYVFTRNPDLEDTEYVQFVSKDHVKFVENLKKLEGADIWLIGGGKLNTMFFNLGLLDEIYVFVMPIVLSDGIELFEAIPDEKQLQLLKTETYSSGVVELRYKLI